MIEKKKEELQKFSKGIPIQHDRAAGIDVGDTEHYVAVCTSTGEHEVSRYEAFTVDLKRLVKDLKRKGITTVAMEATGVYWLNLYLLLQEAGIDPWLVNAKHVKNVTGRKKDDTDAIWIQKLHACGLLQKCFQPNDQYRILRTYVRQRKNIIRIASDSARRMQKAMELMNIKLHTVISDLLGKTGMQMIQAILGGEREPENLRQFIDPRVKADPETIMKSLEGVYKDEYLFMLRQAFDEYTFYQNQINDCDARIKHQLLQQVAIIKDGDVTDLPQNDVKKKPRKNEFRFAANPYLKALTGVDLCAIPSISGNTAIEFLSEVGTDMHKWPSAKHFAAWLNLVPNTKISGGKVISSTMPHRKNKAGQSLKMAASSLSNSKSGLGDEYRRMRAKFGGKGAALAMAHKLARIIYKMLKERVEYDDKTITKNQEKFKAQKIQRLEKQIQRLREVA